MKPNSQKNSGPRRPSPNCLTGLPARSKKSSRSEKSVRPDSTEPKQGPVRFDDFVADCMGIGRTQTFVGANAGLARGNWVAPKADSELDAIFAAVMGGVAFGGKPFSLILEVNHRTLFVGIVDIDQDTPRGVDVEPGKGFGSELQTISCLSMKVLLPAAACNGIDELELPVARWNIARRKFSLPTGKHPHGMNYVSGPYVVVAAYEPESMVVARMRAWPVWFCPNDGLMAPVRSNLERAACDALSSEGIVFTTPTGKELLGVLEEELGDRWEGNLGSYGFQPDIVVLPPPGHPPIVIEIFGLRWARRYDATKAKKKAAGLKNPDICFIAIEARRLDVAEVYRQVALLVADHSRGVWRLGIDRDTAA